MSYYKSESPKPFYLQDDSFDSNPELTHLPLSKNVPFYMNSEIKTSPQREKGYLKSQENLIYPFSVSANKLASYKGKNLEIVREIEAVVYLRSQNCWYLKNFYN